jgi:hypothetical protein
MLHSTGDRLASGWVSRAIWKPLAVLVNQISPFGR